MAKTIAIDGKTNVQATEDTVLGQKLTAATGKGCKAYSVANLKPDEPTGHLVYVSDEALADRKAVYGLATDAEALAQIMKEHHARLNPKP